MLNSKDQEKVGFTSSQGETNCFKTNETNRPWEGRAQGRAARGQGSKGTPTRPVSGGRHWAMTPGTGLGAGTGIEGKKMPLDRF